MNKIPCFLVVRDRFICTKNMVEYLVKIPELRVIILDNASTYQPLLNWYNTNPCEVERLTANYGNFVLFSATTAVPGHEKPDFRKKYECDNSQYILSDCDLDLSGIPTDLVSVLQEGLRKYSGMVKCGLSLRVDDLPDTALAREAMGWERNNWSPHGYLDNLYIKAPVDTTFALYTGIGEQNDFDRCIRVGEPYTARHITWYYGPQNPPPEDELHYLKNISKSHNHYSSRLANMLEGKPLNEGLV